jgi:tetratricopeptide (TPR) repeat protein
MKEISKIESFLDGTMKDEEKAEFEKRIASDKKLASEVALYQAVNEAIKEEDVHQFRISIRNILHQHNNNIMNLRTRVTRFIKYPIAATILILIGLSLWQLILNKSSLEVYNMFYNPYQTDISTRSGEQLSDKIQLSYLLYQEGDYEASFEILKNYLADNFNDQTAHFYYGMNAIELQHDDLAIKELKVVAEDLSTPFSIHAQWYLAMTYLKNDQQDEAIKYIKQLAGSNNFYTQKANKILKML